MSINTCHRLVVTKSAMCRDRSFCEAMWSACNAQDVFLLPSIMLGAPDALWTLGVVSVLQSSTNPRFFISSGAMRLL